MIKKYKNYIIFAVVLIVLLGTYFLISSIDNKGEETPEFSNTAVKVYELSADEISKIRIKNETGEYTFLYDGTIEVLGKNNIDINEDLIEGLRTELSIMTADNTVKENADNLSDYGLDNPCASLTVTDKDANDINIYLGDKSPVGNGYYMKKDNESIVYILSLNKSEVMLRKLDYYRNTVLISVLEENVTKLSFEKYGGKKVEFEANPTDEEGRLTNSYYIYNMTTPFNWDAVDSEVSKVISSLTSFAIADYIEDNPTDVTAYGFNPYYAKISVEQKDGENYDILLGKSVDSKFYVKLANSPAVYTVNASAFTYLDFEPEAFLQPFAYIKGIDTVKKLVYNYKNEVKAEFEVAKAGDEEYDIKRNGKYVSQSSFRTMYTEIISMEIGGKISYNINKEPVLTYEFYFNDGSKDVVCYYEYDERKLALSINNKIQFYVDKTEFETRVNKINQIIKNEL